MKVLVFGSRGFLGRCVTRRAQKAGIDVEEVSSSLGNGLDPETGLLRKGFNISSDTSAVIYLSQSPHSNEGADGLQHAIAVNAFAPVQVAAMAAKAGAARFVYISTGTVYGPSFSPLGESSPLRRDSLYALSKVHAEESLSLLRNRLNLTVVRPFALYGPRQSNRLVPKLAESIRQGRKVTLQPRVAGQSDSEDGGLRISLCHVEDAADAILSFAANDVPACVNLASPEALSIMQIAQSLGEQMGKAPEFQVDAQSRTHDLVADTRLLASCCPVEFRPFSEGVKSLGSWCIGA
jgi:nucleoside-diphosphate-sugar epimerase